jgi:hypothetical protein
MNTSIRVLELFLPHRSRSFVRLSWSEGCGVYTLYTASAHSGLAEATFTCSLSPYTPPRCTPRHTIWCNEVDLPPPAPSRSPSFPPTRLRVDPGRSLASLQGLISAKDWKTIYILYIRNLGFKSYLCLQIILSRLPSVSSFLNLLYLSHVSHKKCATA